MLAFYIRQWMCRWGQMLMMVKKTVENMGLIAGKRMDIMKERMKVSLGITKPLIRLLNQGFASTILHALEQ
ncbi:hypothetical protein ES703_72973 [subsurface metagenome]